MEIVVARKLSFTTCNGQRGITLMRLAIIVHIIRISKYAKILSVITIGEID